MKSRIVVDSNEVPWQSGFETLDAMNERARSDLGAPDRVNAAYARLKQKRLFHDPSTGRRLDIVHLGAGYEDPTPCYHHSAEESYKLWGESDLPGSEGPLAVGDYFWRPPGWVHASTTANGVTTLLGMEGIARDSGPVTRHAAPTEAIGTNLIHTDLPAALGPRGWIRGLRSAWLPWQPGRLFARTEGHLRAFDLDRVGVKILSKDWSPGGAQTLLLRLMPRYRQLKPGRHAATTQLFVLEGSFSLGNEAFSAGMFLHRPGGSAERPMESETGCLVYMKVDGRLNFLPE